MLQRYFAGFGIALAALFLAVAAYASGPPYGIPSGVLQDEWHKYRGYENLYQGPREPHPNPAAVTESPSSYYLHITHPAAKHKADDPNIAVLMAHVPVDATVWFDGQATKASGKVRWFETSSLEPGYNYAYNIRVVWNENGKWVSETQKVTFQAGDIRCVDLMPIAHKGMAAEVVANLSKLNPEDRKLAEQQKFCAIQNDKSLGEMGVPFKIVLKGQPVFLCCDGCEKAARSNPEQTLAKVEELKAKNKTSAIR